MLEQVVSALLWFCAIGSGLVAGLFFAFSTFIMPALAKIAPPHGISAMQSINSTILRSLFMPVFFGTTLASAVLALAAVMQWDQPGILPMLSGALVYILGMFTCTAVFNVPLNNQLAAVSAQSSEALPVWSRYLSRWTRWNHVRTIASTVACSLFIAALSRAG
jgi:uncharacterized membrane protein